jgi:hypothetical protein
MGLVVGIQRVGLSVGCGVMVGLEETLGDPVGVRDVVGAGDTVGLFVFLSANFFCFFVVGENEIDGDEDGRITVVGITVVVGDNDGRGETDGAGDTVGLFVFFTFLSQSFFFSLSFCFCFSFTTLRDRSSPSGDMAGDTTVVT